MKEISNTRKGLAVVLTFVIICMSVYLWHNKDTILRNEINITYPDGCVEQYINKEHVNKICENGRLMAEQATTPRAPQGFELMDFNNDK